MAGLGQEVEEAYIPAAERKSGISAAVETPAPVYQQAVDPRRPYASCRVMLVDMRPKRKDVTYRISRLSASPLSFA